MKSKTLEFTIVALLEANYDEGYSNHHKEVAGRILKAIEDKMPKKKKGELMTASQILDRLKISKGHLYTLIESGKLHAVNVADPTSSRPSYRVYEEDVENLLDRNVYRKD